METQPLTLQPSGELLDDNLGTTPTYTLAIWFYSEEAYKKRNTPSTPGGPTPKVVLQRMYLDARRTGWYPLPGGTREVASDDQVLAYFRPIETKPILDAIGYHAVVTSVCPQAGFGSGTDAKDWAIWAEQHPARTATSNLG